MLDTHNTLQTRAITAFLRDRLEEGIARLPPADRVGLYLEPVGPRPTVQELRRKAVSMMGPGILPILIRGGAADAC